jgi:phosphatidate cytidylyltransferase
VIGFADPTDLAYIIFATWLTGCVLLTILTLLPATRSKLNGVWPLMLSEAGILFAGTVPWLLPLPFLGAALTVAASRIGYECGVTLGGPSHPRAGAVGASLLIGLALFAWFVNYMTDSVSLGAWLAALIAVAVLAMVQSLKEWFWRFLIFPALPFVLFVNAAWWPEMASLFVLSLFIVEIFDSFALLGGRLFGKRPLAPKLSPRKTWEGLAVGLIAVVFAACAITFTLEMDVLTLAAIAGASTIGAIIGDLAASAAKRRAHVKDYPAVITSQGGLLDIYDSWIVAGPLSVGTVMLLNYFA